MSTQPEVGDVPGGKLRLDYEGKVLYDLCEPGTLLIDGVRVTVDILVSCVNPDPSKYFQARREGDIVTVTQYTRGALMADLGMISPDGVERAELDKLAHSLAFQQARVLLESSCLCMGVCAEGWHNLDDVDEMAVSDVSDAVKYLEARGLLQHDEHNPSMVAVRDESEATA